MSVDVHELRSAVARVAELTGAGFDDVDYGVVLVAGVGRVGVSSVAKALRAAGLSVRERSGDHTSDDHTSDDHTSDDHTSDGRAGVALLILDPSSGVAEPEVELLRDLSEAASIVALVCNKIDAFWDWPTLLRANRQILDPHGRRPIFAVSAAAALAGHVAGSGFDALTEWLSEQLDPTDRPDRLAAVAAERRLDAFIEDLAGPDHRVDPAAGLMTERAAVAATRDRGRLDRMTALRGGVGQIRGDVLGAVSGATRVIAAQASEAAMRMSRSDATAFARRLEDELTQLRVRTLARLDNELDGLRARTLLGLDQAEPAAATRSSSAVTMPALPPPRRGAEEVLLVVFGASAGLGLGRLVVTPMASVDTLQWIAMPLTLVLGVVIAVGMVRVRRLSMLRGAMTSWAQDAVGDVRTQIEHEVARRVLSAESVIGGRLARHYEQRASVSAGRVADLDREIRHRRQLAVARRESDLAQLAAAVQARDDLDRVLAALGH